MTDCECVRYIFSLSCYERDDIRPLFNLCDDYLIVFGREICPATQVPYIVGLLFRKDYKPFCRSAAAAILPDGCLLVAASSCSLNFCVGYCIKEGNWWTNICPITEVEHAREVVHEASTFSTNYEWIGHNFFNVLFNHEFHPCLSYYSIFKVFSKNYLI